VRCGSKKDQLVGKDETCFGKMPLYLNTYLKILLDKSSKERAAKMTKQ
jgi:hypothetical protein